MWQEGDIQMTFCLQQKKVYRVPAEPFDKQQTKKLEEEKNER